MKPRARCGIYCILNRVSGESYVGQAVNVAARFKSHIALLQTGKHHSKRLQASFDRDGRDAFSVRVLEDCPKADLNRREHDWMLRVKPSLNGMHPDYITASRGLETDGKLKRRRLPAPEPSRFLCACGQLKSIGSRGCLACLKALAAKMKADGFLPKGHRFEWEANPQAVGSSPRPLGRDAVAVSRAEFFGEEPRFNVPGPKPGDPWTKGMMNYRAPRRVNSDEEFA